MPHPVAIYARVSRLAPTDERSRSVDDQLADLRAWADREDWPVVAEVRDDGISASRFAPKSRPGWAEVMDIVGSGKIKALLIWEFSRASRDDGVTSALKAACAQAGVRLGYSGQLTDVSTADGSFRVGIDGLVAARYSAELSEKMIRSTDSRAAAGRPHGRVPFGYRRVIDPATGKTTGREEDPTNGPIVREIVRRLLAREPANAVATDLNSRGIRTPMGREWAGGNLTKMVVAPAYAGIRIHHGQALDGVTATWPALITEAEHRALLAMLADPSRDRFRNDTRVRHLGTGIYRCGKAGCGGVVRVVWRRGPSHAPAYSCASCHGTTRDLACVDAVAEQALVTFLARTDVVAELAANDHDPDVQAAAAEAARLRADLDGLRARVASHELTLDDLAFFRRTWEPQLADAERRARPRHVPSAVLAVAGPDAAARWQATALADRRAILAALVTVTIMPVGKGRWKFDPASVVVERRTG